MGRYLQPQLVRISQQGICRNQDIDSLWRLKRIKSHKDDLDLANLPQCRASQPKEVKDLVGQRQVAQGSLLTNRPP